MKLTGSKTLLSCLLIVISVCAFGQTGQLRGKTVDANTNEPLPFTSVFINNTTIATSSGTTGEFILKNIPFGQQDIIFSFVGYQSYQTRLVIKAGNPEPLLIKLTPSAQKLQELEVISARDRTWEKQLKKFEKVFIGEDQWASGTKIKNPWVIEFLDDSKTLSAKASQPLEIENGSLGYRIFYNLTDFKFSGNSYSIIGDMHFEEMSPRDAVQALQWMKNRELVYLSSVRHLMKSIINQKIEKEGFRLYTDKVTNKIRSNNFSHELDYNLVPFDTTGIVSKGVGNEYRILFKQKIEVHNTNEISKSGFYRDISYGVSWLETTGGYIRVNREGTVLNPREIVISGDMSSGRIASLLPLDYTRGSLITIETHEELDAKRLQEKAYVQTDKPYYYPGEQIWYSGFMNYQASGLMDTLSKVLYVELIDSNRMTIKSVISKIDSGRTWGNIKIPKSVTPGNYVLRAYTQWMRNYGVGQFYYKPIPILALNDRVDNKAAVVIQPDTSLIMHTDKALYHKREKVKMSIAVKDGEGNPIAATLSISITDTEQVIPVEEKTNIINDYPLNNDLPTGMLTKFTYPVERGITAEGVFLNEKDKPQKTRVTILQDKMERIFQETTNDKGKFILTGMDFYDSVRFGIQVENGKVVWKKRDEPLLPPLTFRALPLVHYQSPQRKSFEYNEDDKAILLKEVEVKSQRIKDGPYESLYGKPDFYIKGEDLAIYGGGSLATAIAARIPGFRLDYYKMHYFLIRTRGEFTRMDGPPAEPVVYIDNQQVITGSGDTGGDRLFAINPAMVDHIEVSSMSSSQLGANGSSGAIYVYTKRVEPDVFKGLAMVKLKGYDSPTVFLSPDYENDPAGVNYFDARSTLYWNPAVVVKETKGMTELTFFTSDMTGTYRVVIEGITSKGKPVRTESLISVVN